MLNVPGDLLISEYVIARINVNVKLALFSHMRRTIHMLLVDSLPSLWWSSFTRFYFILLLAFPPKPTMSLSRVIKRILLFFVSFKHEHATRNELHQFCVDSCCFLCLDTLTGKIFLAILCHLYDKTSLSVWIGILFRYLCLCCLL